MRKYLRSIAHARMRKMGVNKPNKARANGRSYFAMHWREWL